MIIGLVINFSLKTLSPGWIRKETVGSGWESRLRVPFKLKNIRRVRITMRRFTKLIHDDCSILIGACSYYGKGASTLWPLSRMYRRPLITNVSHPFQGVSAQADIM